MSNGSKQTRRPVMLVVLDGWGWREDTADNAVRQANTPTFNRLWANGPHAFLRTDGREVGLPPGQMGNSEVGHLNIGAGRVVMQDLPRIADAIESGEIKQAPALTGLIAALKKSGGTCHLIGLVSPGGVHSHQDHGAALAQILTEAGVPAVAHAITDGRDTPPQSAGDDIARLAAALPPSAPIATVCGRYYSMDRDKRWERVGKAYAAMVDADAPRFPNAGAVVAAAYAEKKFDEFIIPAVVGDYRGMRDGDGILCFNFRADRVREILAAMLDPAFTGFSRPRVVRFAAAIGMTQYSDALDKFMLDDEALAATFKRGKDTSENDDIMLKSMYGQPGPIRVHAKFAADAPAIFDYKTEMTVAQIKQTEMLKEAGVELIPKFIVKDAPASAPATKRK